MKCLCDSPAGTKIIADLRQDKELDLQEGSVHRFLHIAQDNFYRDLTLEEQAHSFNFDHPTVSSIPHLCHAKLSFETAFLPMSRSVAFCMPII